jgi:glutathione synthase
VIRPFLESIKDSDERNAFILMEIIKPPVLTNYMVRAGQEVIMVKTVSELGIFGSIIG